MSDKIREPVDYEIFSSWVANRFPEYQTSNGEIKINSLFIEDYKQHLWCNPKKNVFRCWKSDERGSLITLVMKVDNCDYASARTTLGLNNRVRNLDAEIEKFMNSIYPDIPEPPPPDTIKLPESTYLISNLSDFSPSKNIAINYLNSRKIPIEGMYFCNSGKYRDRIIIPYYGEKKNINYWNGRDITGKHNLKYWSPSLKECGVGKEDVIYFYKIPPEKQTIVLTEGEFDAISLTLSGLWGAAVSGKEISNKQIQMIKNNKICLSFDNDKWWKQSLSKIGQRLLKEGFELTFVCPPVGYKDWNSLLVDKSPESIKKYVEKNQTVFDQWTLI